MTGGSDCGARSGARSGGRSGPPIAPVWAIVLVLLFACGWLRIRRPYELPLGEPAIAMPDMRLDLNEASEAELTALPGVGPRLAERIVADRVTRGPFASVADLARVKRVGPTLVAEIRPLAVAESRTREPGR